MKLVVNMVMGTMLASYAEGEGGYGGRVKRLTWLGGAGLARACERGM